VKLAIAPVNPATPPVVPPVTAWLPPKAIRTTQTRKLMRSPTLYVASAVSFAALVLQKVLRRHAHKRKVLRAPPVPLATVVMPALERKRVFRRRDSKRKTWLLLSPVWPPYVPPVFEAPLWTAVAAYEQRVLQAAGDEIPAADPDKVFTVKND